jgi:hypothetical protein
LFKYIKNEYKIKWENVLLQNNNNNNNITNEKIMKYINNICITCVLLISNNENEILINKLNNRINNIINYLILQIIDYIKLYSIYCINICNKYNENMLLLLSENNINELINLFEILINKMFINENKLLIKFIIHLLLRKNVITNEIINKFMYWIIYENKLNEKYYNKNELILKFKQYIYLNKNNENIINTHVFNQLSMYQIFDTILFPFISSINNTNYIKFLFDKFNQWPIININNNNNNNNNNIMYEYLINKIDYINEYFNYFYINNGYNKVIYIFLNELITFDNVNIVNKNLLLEQIKNKNLNFCKFNKYKFNDLLINSGNNLNYYNDLRIYC